MLVVRRFGGCFLYSSIAAKANKATMFIARNYKKKKLVIVASNEEYEFEFLKHPDTINIYVPVGLKTK